MQRRADQRKFHYIYKIIRDDGRYYIGMHSTDDIDDGYFGSGKKITRSVKKHGLEKHTKEILEFLPTREALRLREEQLVTEEVVNDPMCMNIATGGHPSGFFSDAHRDKWLAAGKNNLKRAHTKDVQKRAIETRIARGTGFRPKPGSWNLATKAASTENAIEKRKKTFSERRHMQGEKNSQFGTRWLTKNGSTIKVLKADVDKFLLIGYRLGRK